MYKLSYSTFGVARFFMAIAVFFCHVFKDFNSFGFLFVGVFFFMSGYGMEISGKRKQALFRIVPYILYFAFFSCLYFFVFQVWIYPSSWFLVVYFVLMVLYRFISSIYGLLVAFVALGLVFMGCGFEFGWCASYGAFLMGVFFARFPGKFTFVNSLLFLPGLPFVFFHVEAALWSVLPLFCWLVLSFSSWRGFRNLAFLGSYTFHFYCVHCFCLGICGATWTLGGEPKFSTVLLAFSLSVFFSIFFKDYLFKYPKVVE